MFTIPSAVKMKFGLAKTTSPIKIPPNPALRNTTVMMPNLRREGVPISDFDFVTLLNIKRIKIPRNHSNFTKIVGQVVPVHMWKIEEKRI